MVVVALVVGGLGWEAADMFGACVWGCVSGGSIYGGVLWRRWMDGEGELSRESTLWFC